MRGIYEIVSLSTTGEDIYFTLHRYNCCTGLNTRHKLFVLYTHGVCYLEMLKETNSHVIKIYPKLSYILVLATLIMYMIITRIISNTLVNRVCRTQFVRYYLIKYSLGLLRAPLSTVKSNKQIKRKRVCLLVNNVIYIRIIL